MITCRQPRWDLLPITGLAGDMHAIREVLDDQQWAAFSKPVAIELKKGECTFHHALTIHGSFENRTERPRRATVINVLLDGTAPTRTNRCWPACRRSQGPADGRPVLSAPVRPRAQADASNRICEAIPLVRLFPRCRYR